MKFQLLLQPIHNSTADILKCFIQGKPLTPDQLNLLYLHQAELSNLGNDLLNYYLKNIREKRANYQNIFLLKDETINRETIVAIRNELVGAQNHLIVHMSLEQLAQFRELNINTINYYHSNQMIPAHLFYPRGVPPVLYFQWGKLFGVIKYVFSNVGSLVVSAIIYFENMENRNLEQCIHDYTQQLQHNIELQKQMMYLNEKKMDEQRVEEAPSLRLSDTFLFHPM